MWRLAWCVLIVVGCDQSPQQPAMRLYPVKGTVERAGKPVTGGGLFFAPHPSGGSSRIMNASVADDGSFIARTEVRIGGKLQIEDGMPAGTYKVICHPRNDGSRLGLETKLEPVFTIEEKENVLKLELSEQKPMGIGETRDDANPREEVK